MDNLKKFLKNVLRWMHDVFIVVTLSVLIAVNFQEIWHKLNELWHAVT